MTLLKTYNWEAIQVAVIAGVTVSLMVGTYLFGTPRGVGLHAANAPIIFPKLMPSSVAATAPSAPAVQAAQVSAENGTAVPKQADPREVTVGASGISNRYKLLNVERKTVSPKSDELTVRLHIDSLAMEPLVSPFESDMLEITGPGLQPIKPSASFRSPIPSGNSRNQDVVFNVPQDLDLNNSALRIHYYNYESEIPLKLDNGLE